MKRYRLKLNSYNFPFFEKQFSCLNDFILIGAKRKEKFSFCIVCHVWTNISAVYEYPRHINLPRMEGEIIVKYLSICYIKKKTISSFCFFLGNLKLKRKIEQRDRRMFSNFFSLFWKNNVLNLNLNYGNEMFWKEIFWGIKNQYFVK